MDELYGVYEAAFSLRRSPCKRLDEPRWPSQILINAQKLMEKTDIETLTNTRTEKPAVNQCMLMNVYKLKVS